MDSCVRSLKLCDEILEKHSVEEAGDALRSLIKGALRAAAAADAQAVASEAQWQLRLKNSVKIVEELRWLVAEQQTALERPETRDQEAQTSETGGRGAEVFARLGRRALVKKYRAEAVAATARADSLEKVIDHLEASLAHKDEMILAGSKDELPPLPPGTRRRDTPLWT